MTNSAPAASRNDKRHRNIGVYSEVRFIGGQPYDDAEFQSLRGTKLVHVSRNSEKILVGASGIHYRAGTTAANRYFLFNTAESAVYSFKDISQNEMQCYGGGGLPKPEVVFFYGVENKIIPTRETENVINELKNPKPKEQPKKNSWISRIIGR